MTREEAIEVLKANYPSKCFEQLCEAVDMAIKALEQEQCDKCVYSTKDGCQYDDITETIPPFEPCEDAVSRQAVIEIAKSSKSNWIDNSVLFKRVNELPSVTAQPKTGHWIPRN